MWRARLAPEMHPNVGESVRHGLMYLVMYCSTYFSLTGRSGSRSSPGTRQAGSLPSGVHRTTSNSSIRCPIWMWKMKKRCAESGSVLLIVAVTVFSIYLCVKSWQK